MRGTVAKRIRRETFGDFVDKREYSIAKRLKQWLNPETKKKEMIQLTGQIRNTGLRKDYQATKRRHKNHEKD